MVQKRFLCPQRVRKIPKQFSWIDKRLAAKYDPELAADNLKRKRR